MSHIEDSLDAYFSRAGIRIYPLPHAIWENLKYDLGSGVPKEIAGDDLGFLLRKTQWGESGGVMYDIYFPGIGVFEGIPESAVGFLLGRILCVKDRRET